MTNIEHLFETGLTLMKKKSPDEWKKSMAKNINWTDDIGITLDELWLLCQYTIYTYSWDLVEVVRCEDCKFSDSKRTTGLNVYCEVCLCYKDADGFCNCGERRESE